jgi:hypothetical protein
MIDEDGVEVVLSALEIKRRQLSPLFLDWAVVFGELAVEFRIAEAGLHAETVVEADADEPAHVKTPPERKLRIVGKGESRSTAKLEFLSLGRGAPRKHEDETYYQASDAIRHPSPPIPGILSVLWIGGGANLLYGKV